MSEREFALRQAAAVIDRYIAEQHGMKRAMRVHLQNVQTRIMLLLKKPEGERR